VEDSLSELGKIATNHQERQYYKASKYLSILPQLKAAIKRITSIRLCDFPDYGGRARDEKEKGDAKLIYDKIKGSSGDPVFERREFRDKGEHLSCLSLCKKHPHRWGNGLLFLKRTVTSMNGRCDFMQRKSHMSRQKDAVKIELVGRRWNAD